MRRIDTLSPGRCRRRSRSSPVRGRGEGHRRRDGPRRPGAGAQEVPRLLLNLSRIGDLREIGEDGETVRIGALVTHRQIERSPILKRRAPLLCEAALLIGSPQLRNLATIGGNIVNASPVADSTPR